MMKRITFTLIMLSALNSTAQDTVSLVYYNLLNFPFINSGRITHLEEIVHYEKPDLFLVNELTSNSGSNTILNSALNTNGVNYYSKAAYVNGPDTENMLYYNTNKFGLISQSEISTSLRDINEYIMYYKEPGMNASSDTVYFYLYSAHLKAGSQPSNETQRAGEVTAFKVHLNSLGTHENVFFGGDFNIYSTNEQAYSNIISGSGYTLVDPLSITGVYNNSAYAIHHTQSTRTTSIDDGATGGMDDRFDMIFHSPDVSTSANRVSMVPGSYRPIGQDGLHYNDGLLDAPTNTSVPSNVLSALYYMSDHLPIKMDLALDVALSDNEIELEAIPFTAFIRDGQLNLMFDEPFEGEVSIFNMSGQLIARKQLANTSQDRINVNQFESGIYVVNLQNRTGVSSKKFWVGNN